MDFRSIFCTGFTLQMQEQEQEKLLGLGLVTAAQLPIKPPTNFGT